MKSLLLISLLLTTPVQAASIAINTAAHRLTFTDDAGLPHSYSIAVGRGAAKFYGHYRVGARAEWPSWTPTPNMIRHGANPHTVPGGPRNPLGARILHIAGTYYGIHGTNNEASIGHDASHGCIRLRRADILDLYPRVSTGTPVTVE